MNRYSDNREECCEDDTTLASSTTPYVIDWILVPCDWKIVGKKVVRSPASDHWPVFMEVQVHSQVAVKPVNRLTDLSENFGVVPRFMGVK